jgi:hypothetical protein
MSVDFSLNFADLWLFLWTVVQFVTGQKGFLFCKAVFLNRRAAAPVPGPGINYTGPREAWGNYSMLQDFINSVDD